MAMRYFGFLLFHQTSLKPTRVTDSAIYAVLIFFSSIMIPVFVKIVEDLFHSDHSRFHAIDKK